MGGIITIPPDPGEPACQRKPMPKPTATGGGGGCTTTTTGEAV
jgi:hypothetical protein